MEFPTSLPMDINNFLIDSGEKKWSGPFTFIQGADTQFGLIDRYILQKQEPNWDKEIVLSKEVIKRINEMNPKPRFFVICGDMLDAFPYSGEESKLRDKQYADFVKIFKDLHPDIKLVCVCGNHDVGDIPSEDTIQVFRKQFGPDYFSFWVGGVKFVVLNSQYFKCPESVPTETEKQLKLLDSVADINAKHIVVFQHIPFFLKYPNESDDVYFNIERNLRMKLLEKLQEAGVRYIFCGHYHRNAGGFYKNVEQVVTSAVGGPLGNDPSGYRVVKVLEDTIIHEYIPLRENTDV